MPVIHYRKLIFAPITQLDIQLVKSLVLFDGRSIIQNKRTSEDEKEMQASRLKEMKPSFFSMGNGRPEPGLTDKEWQEELAIRKLYITPYGKYVAKLTGRYSHESNLWNSEINGEYHGPTNWKQYCDYINSVLSAIRSGERDYCYYKYQIMDLLKFHYDTLRTKYCDGYWEVWLERGGARC